MTGPTCSINGANPDYCSEKCKRKDMPLHRLWHKKLEVALQHKREALKYEGEETREKMLNDAVDDYDLQNIAAMELMDQGQTKAAVKRLHKLIKSRPWEPEAHFNLGGVHTTAGDHVKALAAFEAAFEWHEEQRVRDGADPA